MCPTRPGCSRARSSRISLRTVVLGSVLETLPSAERAEAVRPVAARLPEPTVDYVRLQASARKAP